MWRRSPILVAAVLSIVCFVRFGLTQNPDCAPCWPINSQCATPPDGYACSSLNLTCVAGNCYTVQVLCATPANLWFQLSNGTAWYQMRSSMSDAAVFTCQQHRDYTFVYQGLVYNVTNLNCYKSTII